MILWCNVSSRGLAISTILWMASIFWSEHAIGQEAHIFNFEVIGDNRIAWSCMGDSQPTIVLIAGMGLSAHQSFNHIYHNYKGRGRICMYDRAGMGESTFAHPASRTLAQLTNELHQLSAHEEWGRLILVAHSFGGFIARSYANKYPDEVVGMLFLDAMHEDWLPKLKARMSEADWAIMEKSISWNLSTFHEDYYEAQEAVRAFRIRKTLPITVVSRGLPHTTVRVAKMSYAGVDIFNAEHDSLQRKLVALSSNAERRIARYSSHMIDDTDPWLAIEEIEKLVQRASNYVAS